MIAERMEAFAVRNSPNRPSFPSVRLSCAPERPHRGAYYVLNKLKVNVTVDIGCYTLGRCRRSLRWTPAVCWARPSAWRWHGEGPGQRYSRAAGGVIGDSTFIHSGITGLVDAVYNGGHITV
jgi:indolepyruvate ferredoxin oxidoreductase alpha subunit